MITNNFKQVMKMYLTLSSMRGFGLPVTNKNGETKYYNGTTGGWPGTVYDNATITTNNAGVIIGSGNAEPSVNDYALENQITSGATVSASSINQYDDGNGNPVKTLLITVTNSSATDITVSEIGYLQKLRCASTQGTTSVTDNLVLFDRTLLNSPVTIPAGETASITYRLKTVIS